jgi:hypothetical protein
LVQLIGNEMDPLGTQNVTVNDFVASPGEQVQNLL